MYKWIKDSWFTACMNMYACEWEKEWCSRGCIVFVLVLPAGSNNHTQAICCTGACLFEKKWHSIMFVINVCASIKFHSNCTRKLNSVAPGQLLRELNVKNCASSVDIFVIKVVQRLAHVCSNFFIAIVKMLFCFCVGNIICIHILMHAFIPTHTCKHAYTDTGMLSLNNLFYFLHTCTLQVIWQ